MMSQSQPGRTSLSRKQLIFVTALLVLGFLLSFLVVRFLDPAAARSISTDHRRNPTADMKARKA